jgi:glyoxylase-like metal-dependent hydrolase (beta-lactamase superfamily II)
MTLRMFGTGGAFSRSYGTTCSLVTFPGGERWLIDCGRQAPDQLYRAGVSWHGLDGQIVTHVHGDHVYGLEDFAFRRYYETTDGVACIRAGGPRPGLVAHTAVIEELWEMLAPVLRYVPDPAGPTSGTLESYFAVRGPTEVRAPKHNRWNHSESFQIGGLGVTARECLHVPGKPSTSLEFELGDGRVAWWSGDSVVDVEWLVKIEPRTTVFFHDCTFTDYPGQVHGSFALLETLPDAVRHKMVLMHHEDDIEANRRRAEDLGFRIGMPGDEWNLASGRRIG